MKRTAASVLEVSALWVGGRLRKAGSVRLSIKRHAHSLPGLLSLILAISIMMPFIAACGQTRTEIDFDTIEITEFGGQPEGSDFLKSMEPRLVVIDNHEESQGEATRWISPRAAEEVKTTDLAVYTVIIAFRGLGGAGPAIEIKEAKQSGNRVELSARFYEPTGSLHFQSINVAYHVVRVKKVGRMAIQRVVGPMDVGSGVKVNALLPLTFVLTDQSGKERAQTVHKVLTYPEVEN